MLTETPTTEENVIEERVRILGRNRMLEGVLTYPTGRATCSVLIAGPHPFLGGDIRNNVVATLSKSLASQGAVVLTFNYGGVGRSEGGPTDWPAVMSEFWKHGTFKEEQGWAEDTDSAIFALRQWCASPPVLVGYSFGCWTIVNCLRKEKFQSIVLISPNHKQHTFTPLCICSAPLLLIHSDNDFTCSECETKAWFDSVREPKTRIQLPAGEHFFRGHEAEVASTVAKFLWPQDANSEA